MQIVRTEQPTGTANRTRREEIVPLLTGTREAEPEMYLDCSESEGWPWDSNPGTSTWEIQLEAVRSFIATRRTSTGRSATSSRSTSTSRASLAAAPRS
jgi:hypothetical protein